MLTVAERIALAEQALREDRIIQREWRDTGIDGRELVCALAAFGPDIDSPKHCPAELMPSWLAELVPVLDDGIAWGDVNWFAGGLIARARGWGALTAEGWDRVHAAYRIACIRQALAGAASVQPEPAPDYWTKVRAACEAMIAALDGAGDAARAEESVRQASAAAMADRSAAARTAAWAAQAAWSPPRHPEEHSPGPAVRAAEAVAQVALHVLEPGSAQAFRRLAEALFEAIDSELAGAGCAASRA